MTLNPKDAIGRTKVPLWVLPPTAIIYGAKACEFGAFKAGKDGTGYGPYNWRESAVIYSIYLDAIHRHLLALQDGEDIASDSAVHHLGHIIANAAIILDAMEMGKLKDDRPTKGKAAELLERLKK